MSDVGLVVLALLVVLYFLPAAIAMNRKAKRSAGIALLNLFLGWTFIGWVGALIWAVSDNTTGHAHVRPGAGSRAPEPGRPAPRSAHPEPGRPTSRPPAIRISKKGVLLSVFGVFGVGIILGLVESFVGSRVEERRKELLDRRTAWGECMQKLEESGNFESGIESALERNRICRSGADRRRRRHVVERDAFVFGPSPFTYEVERKPTSSYRPPSTAVPLQRRIEPTPTTAEERRRRASKGGFQRSWPQYFEGQRVPSALQRAPRGNEIELMMLCGYEGYPWSLERCERWAKRRVDKGK